MDLTLKRTENLIDALETINDKLNFRALINFRRTVYGFKILIDVMHCELANNADVICTKEYLTKRVSSLASRATIINFINDQISVGTLIANNSAVDGRIKVITPSEDLRNDYKYWLEYLAK
ncbi:hypothetical protein N9T16_03320 [Pelagibacteraceae bacterium]|nr:hypothetical protein [Pelagibacteraceae bacterium]MDC1302983.1 hypothetical protein [Pelagibacterales bacterium]